MSPQGPQNKIKSETSVVLTVHTVNPGSSKEAPLPPALKHGGRGEEGVRAITTHIKC